ncbi:MAG: pilus assembly protein TadG-related protein, partial [Propionibacteriaceae bacterium]
MSRRHRRERGAVAVVVAIWMVVALGFAAISIDVGSIYSDKKQLQNGADAAALAIAESCVRGSCVDSADQYAKANKLATGSVATGKVVFPGTDYTDGVVVVQTDTLHQNWFASVLGMATTPISATATAEWGYPSGGPVLPLTFSWCAFWKATGGWDDKGVPLQ